MQPTERRESLARKIKETFQTELKSAFAQLRGLREDASFAQVGMGPPILRGSYLTSKHLSYPYFQSAFWADCYGRQILKFDTRQAPTPSIDVSRFAFFKDAKSQIVQTNTQPEVNRVCFEVPRFWTRPITPLTVCISSPFLSPNTDEFAPTLSAPFKTELENAKKIWIQALVVRPISVVDPVLPPGFGFAVIDEQCEVLFHSDSSRNLRENFCDESKNKTELAPLVGWGRQRFIEHYLRGPQRTSLHHEFSGAAPIEWGWYFSHCFSGTEPGINSEFSHSAGLFDLARELFCRSRRYRCSSSVIAWAAQLDLYAALYVAAIKELHVLSSTDGRKCTHGRVFGIVSRQLYEASLLALSIEIAFLSIGFSIAVLACCPHTLRRWG